MSFFKRTYKLLMSVNLNIPVVSVSWLQCLISKSENKNQIALERFFLKRTDRGFNFDQLKAAYFYRKTLRKGFLEGYTIIGKIINEKTLNIIYLYCKKFLNINYF